MCVCVCVCACACLCVRVLCACVCAYIQTHETQRQALQRRQQTRMSLDLLHYYITTLLQHTHLIQEGRDHNDANKRAEKRGRLREIHNL